MKDDKKKNKGKKKEDLEDVEEEDEEESSTGLGIACDGDLGIRIAPGLVITGEGLEIGFKL